MLRKEVSEHLDKFYHKPYLWSNPYCILSIGEASIDVIKQDIKNQEAP